MTNPDNKALNATEKKDTRTQVGIVSGAIVGFVIVIIALVLMRGCEQQPKLAKDYKHKNDSLRNVLKAKDKYIGIVEADLSKQTDRRVKAENALRDRKPIYGARVERIIADAPDTCKEYLIAVRNECDTLQAKSDSLINELKIEVAKSDTVIEAYKSKGETLEHFNDKLISENKELGKENKQLVKSNKRANFWGKVAIGAAVVWTGVVMYVTISK